MACLPIPTSGGCLPHGVGGPDLIQLKVEVRFTRSIDRLGLGIREEVNTSLDVVIHISRHEEELTYRWLVNETRIQFKLETGIEIEEGAIFGIFSYFHGNTMNFSDEVLQTLDDTVREGGGASGIYFRFKLIHTGPIHQVNDQVLLVVASFVGANPNRLSHLCKVSTRFRRVFSRDEAWSGCEYYLERAYNNTTAGLSPGISSMPVNSWLRDESGLPLVSASRVRWVSLTSSRVGIYLGSLDNSANKASLARRLYTGTVHWLAEHFSGPNEYLKRVKQSIVEPWHYEQNIVMLAPGSRAQLLLDCLQFCLPRTSNKNALHVGAALHGYTIVDRPINTGARDGDRVTTRLELPHNDAALYFEQTSRPEREKILSRCHSMQCVGDQRLVISIGSPSRATTLRTAAHILTIPCRLPVSSVLDKLPDIADAKMLMEFIPAAFHSLPETAALRARVDKDVREQWHQNTFSAASIAPALTSHYNSGRHSSSSNSNSTLSDDLRPVLVLLVLEGMGRPNSSSSSSSIGGDRVWGEDEPRTLSRAVAELPTQILEPVLVTHTQGNTSHEEMPTTATATTTTTAGTIATATAIAAAVLPPPASNTTAATSDDDLEDIFRKEEQRRVTAKEMHSLAREEATALREFQVKLIWRCLVQELLQMAHETVLSLTTPRHHQRGRWGTSSSSSAFEGRSLSPPRHSSSRNHSPGHRPRPWHIQVVNYTTLNHLAYAAGPTMSNSQRKRALSHSGLTCAVNSLIRMMTNNNTQVPRK